MNKQKKPKCKKCKDPFMPYSSFEKYCIPCAIKVGRSDRAKLERKETRARKIAIKTRSEWIKDAQKAFNAYVRERDKLLSCISCGSNPSDSDLVKGSRFDCGHYRSVGSCPELRFEPLNAARQCVKCNRELSGNIVNYRNALVKRIGQDKVDWIEGPHQAKKYSIDEIKEITKEYKAKLKELKELDD